MKNVLGGACTSCLVRRLIRITAETTESMGVTPVRLHANYGNIQVWDLRMPMVTFLEKWLGKFSGVQTVYGCNVTAIALLIRAVNVRLVDVICGRDFYQLLSPLLS